VLAHPRQEELVEKRVQPDLWRPLDLFQDLLQRIGAAVVVPAKAIGGDDASGKVGKDRGEGDSSLEVRDVPTGGGRRAATTVCSDSGADRTACEHVRPVKNRRWARYEAVLGESEEECMAFGRETTPERTQWGASGIRITCETNFSAGKSAGLLGFHITLG
jgi:hypothetical protein